MSGAGSKTRERPRPPSDGEPSLAARALCGVFLALAYFPLLLPSRSQDPLEGIEDWLFLPGEGSSGVIVVLAAWLLSRRWRRLVALPSGSIGLFAVSPWFALGISLAAWANWSGAEDLLALSLALNAIGMALLYRGWAGVRCIGLPLAVLLLALPLPGIVFNEVVFQFQLWTADWAGWLLMAMGVTAHVSGDLIIRPEDHFAIIEGCSGMRSIEALTLLAVLLVDSFGRRGIHAVVVVALAPGVAFFMNGLRVLTLIFNPHSEIVAIHNLQGVVVLLGGLAILVGVDWALERALPSSSAPETGLKPPAGSAGGRESRGATENGGRGPQRLGSRPALVVLAASALVSLLVSPPPVVPARAAALQTRFAAGLSGWEWSPLALDTPFLGTTGFRESFHARFQQGSDEIDLFVGVGRPRPRGASVVSPKTAYPGQGWTVEVVGTRRVEGIDSEVEWRLLRSGADRVLSYRWHPGFSGAFRHAVEDFSGWGALRAGAPEGDIEMAVRVSTPLVGPSVSGMARARARLEAFVAEAVPILTRLQQQLGGNDFSQNTLMRKNSSLTVTTHLTESYSKTGTYDISRRGTVLAN